MIFINLVSFLFFYFFYSTKTDLVFTNPFPFFLPFTKTDLICKNYIYIYIFQNRSEFSFKRGHIHKTNSFKLILPSVYHVCYNISFNIIQKGIYQSLESRRPDSVWAEQVPNTFPFRNLAPELKILVSRLLFCL